MRSCKSHGLTGRKLENSPETYSEINARKTVYKRVCTRDSYQIADMFPQDGWVNTTHVSRECRSLVLTTDGLIRKRRDREEAMELEHTY